MAEVSTMEEHSSHGISISLSNSSSHSSEERILCLPSTPEVVQSRKRAKKKKSRRSSIDGISKSSSKKSSSSKKKERARLSRTPSTTDTSEAGTADTVSMLSDLSDHVLTANRRQSLDHSTFPTTVKTTPSDDDDSFSVTEASFSASSSRLLLPPPPPPPSEDDDDEEYIVPLVCNDEIGCGGAVVDTTATDDSAEQQQQQPYIKQVRFDHIEWREYPVELGDNPSCSEDGPPLTIDWDYQHVDWYDVQEFETMREEHGGRRSAIDLMIAPSLRSEIALRAGYSMQEIDQCMERAEKVRRQRVKTLDTKDKFSGLSKKIKHSIVGEKFKKRLSFKFGSKKSK